MAASSADDDFVADINVTPFVDVMLVLLIIFMVTAPMMTEGLDVALPKVETSEVLPTDDDHIILTIKSNGALYLDEYETGMADLPEVLATRVKNAGRQLFVRADKDVPYGTVMHVMDRVRGAGPRAQLAADALLQAVRPPVQLVAAVEARLGRDLLVGVLLRHHGNPAKGFSNNPFLTHHLVRRGFCRDDASSCFDGFNQRFAFVPRIALGQI